MRYFKRLKYLSEVSLNYNEMLYKLNLTLKLIVGVFEYLQNASTNKQSKAS